MTCGPRGATWRHLQALRHVGHDLGLDIVLSSHLLEEVERVSDAVVILDAGRVVRSGQLDELRTTEAQELYVEIDGPTAQLVDALVAAGLVAIPADGAEGAVVVAGRVVVALEGDVVYDVVRDTVASLGVPLRRLEQRRASLEEVFLSAGSAASGASAGSEGAS